MYDEKLAREILSYLREHPHSGDSVEGISRWWVMRQRISESVYAVLQVLEHLQRVGLISEHRMADGRNLYFANTNPHTTELDAIQIDFEGGLLQ
jgi:Fe2+ or Zn2+ uptake regulation protein